MWHGYVIRMHMHAVVRNVQHSQYYSCMRLYSIYGFITLVILFLFPFFGYSFISYQVFFMRIQNWAKTSLVEKMKGLAERRKLEDLTIGPVLTVRVCFTTKSIWK